MSRITHNHNDTSLSLCFIQNSAMEQTCINETINEDSGCEIDRMSLKYT